jgi:hypothetical protein
VATSKSKSAPKPASADKILVQFVNYELNEDERKRFKAWAHENAADMLSMFDRLLDDGYGFSCKWDERSECVAAFVQCRQENSPNKGWLLTGRGSTAFSAIAGALYRHYVLFEGVWPIDQNRRGVLDDEW